MVETVQLKNPQVIHNISLTLLYLDVAHPFAASFESYDNKLHFSLPCSHQKQSQLKVAFLFGLTWAIIRSVALGSFASLGQHP